MRKIALLLPLFFMAVMATAPAQTLMINEMDADQAGTDAAEFVELYDGGTGLTSLNGFILVFYNGSSDTSYLTLDLATFTTDASGYFVAGNAGIVPTPLITWPNNTLQNGADAVALYFDSAANFPNGTAVTATNLVDAVVYDTNDNDDLGLLAVLSLPGQPQVNEGGGNGSIGESIGRCVDGAGGPLNTSMWVTMGPTPGAANVGNCNPFTMTITQDIPNCGPIMIGVTGANPNSELYNLFSLSCSFGSGALFGVGTDAFYQIFFPLGTPPFHVMADGVGSYNLAIPTGCTTQFTLEAVSIEVSPGTPTIIQVSPQTACTTISI